MTTEATITFENDNFSPSGSSSVISEYLYKVGSFFTDPICLVRENYLELFVADDLYPEQTFLEKICYKAYLAITMAVYAAVALPSALLGMGFRFLATNLQNEPFLYFHNSSAIDKQLNVEGNFSLLSWNVCCVPGGYCISDGGVVPWERRVDAILEKINETGADVNCLYETFDTTSAHYIAKKLSENGYGYVYYNIGAQALGVSSGMLVASKYPISRAQFHAFPKETLVGRTKAAAKGVFSFELQSNGSSFARVFSTHLQHSEIPAEPTAEEIRARSSQMQIILRLMENNEEQLCSILTGDLNMDISEYSENQWDRSFQRDADFDHNTWAGDEYSARLMQKAISGELTLDHTALYRGTGVSIDTGLLDPLYDPSQYRSSALSDHAGLISQIRV